MPNINIRRLYYHVKHHYFTLNNAVIAAAFIIAAGWAWGAVQVMQRNYGLQKNLDEKNQQLQLVQLQTDTLRFEQTYYQSDEYKKLAVRESLGLVDPGEKLLVLPPNSQAARDADTKTSQKAAVTQQAKSAASEPSNFTQWTNFLFGESR